MRNGKWGTLKTARTARQEAKGSPTITSAPPPCPISHFRRSYLMLMSEHHRQVVPRKHVRVHHPAHRTREEQASHLVAFGSRGDRRLRAEDGMAVLLLEPSVPLAGSGHAPVHV